MSLVIKTNLTKKNLNPKLFPPKKLSQLNPKMYPKKVIAQTHFGLSGIAVAVGEQPIKGLVNNAAQARMTVGECLTNLMFAKSRS